MQDRNLTLAVEMGGTAWKAAVMSEGQALARESRPTFRMLTDAVRLWDPDLMPGIHIAVEPELSGVRGCEILVERAMN